MTSKQELLEQLTVRCKRAGVTLTAAASDRLAAYYELLARWNQRINLTALQLNPLRDSTLDRLLVEPLVAAGLVADSPVIWFDLGSGGGSPAVPMKIVRPAPSLTMVEARSKKGAFLREVARELGLASTTVLTCRIEDLDAPATADLVTVRAVKADPGLFSSTARLLRPGGRLLVFGLPRQAIQRREPVSPFTADPPVQLLPDAGSELVVLRKSV